MVCRIDMLMYSVIVVVKECLRSYEKRKKRILIFGKIIFVLVEIDDCF